VECFEIGGVKSVPLLCLSLLLLATLSVPPARGVEISEILPDNSGGLRDEDGETPGWIEIRNPSNATVDLAGWHLTDNAALPAKWTFPAVSIPANSWLVVFTSGKDRALPGSPLHTNFQLAALGEYLALTNPAGAVISGFSPSYPKLRRNVSFAVTSQPVVIPLLPAGAAMRYQVPSNASQDNQWYNVSYNDAAWAAGTFPAGFDANGGNGQPLLSVDFNDRDNNTTDNTQTGFNSFLIGNTGGNAATQTGSITRTISGFPVTLTNTGTDPYDDRYRTGPTDGGGLTTHRLLRDFVFSRDQTGTSGLDITVTGLPANQACKVYVWSFDNTSAGSRVSDWYANGVLKVDNYTFNGSSLPTTDTAARVGFEAVADGAGTLVIGGRRDPASSSFGVFLNAFQIIPQGFSGLVQTNLSSAMRPLSGSVYVRAPFTVADPAVIPQLQLKVRYDDGFTARINGQLVASRNAPASPAWNSLATASRTTAEATTYEEIIIPSPPGLLVAGTNVLAVQGLNVGPNDPDFLTDVQLDGIGASAVTPFYFATPTPGAANAQAFAGVVADTKFTADRGFYAAPFSTAITTATPGAEIRYTLDGTVPTQAAGLLYNSPLLIDKTTILRAAAFVPGFIPSNTDTQTYLFPAQTLQQPANPPGWPATWGTDSEVPGGTVVSDYEMDPDVVNNTQPGYSVLQALNALPSLSLSLPPEDFLGPNGIYQLPKNTGDAWERACAIEFMDPAKPTDRFAENCQVEVHGNSSRRPFRVQKHSFRLTFKSELGSPRLEFPLFPGSPVKDFNQLILRACFTDAWCLVSWDPGRYRPDDATYIRDVWMKRTHEAMGYLAPDSRFCHLYINGLYWGMYNVSERIDKDYVASHRGGLPTDWEVVSDFVDPDASATSAWKSMFNVANAGLSTPAAYQAIQQWLDPVAFADYYLLHQFGEAEDWPHHNGYAFRHRTAAGSRYQWITWDQEIALNNHGIDRVSANAPNTATDRTPGRLLNKLRDNAEFRLLFADRAHRHLHNGGALDAAPSQTRWSGIASWIDQAIVAESARWGDTADATPYGNTGESRPGIPLKPVYTRAADWLPTINLTRDTWIPSLHNRSNSYATIRRLQAAGLYPLTDPPVLNPRGGISASAFTISLSSAAGEIFYTTDGSDPREAVTGNVLGTLYQNPLILTTSAVVKARVRDNGVWSALTEASYIVGVPASTSNLRISEIYYHPPDSGTEPEFIELLNTSNATLDLSRAQFTEGISWIFPDGTLLAPGDRMVVTGNQFTGKLDNAGEFITLRAADGSVIFRFSYSDRVPWPLGTDGEGASLVMMSPGADPADPANWRPSSSSGGSPGTSDATSYTGHPTADSDGDGASDFLEYALGTSPANAASFPAPEISLAGGRCLITFRRAAAADDVRIVPESAADLSGWTAGLVLQSRTPDGAGWLVDVWEWTGPLPERLFFRLRAVK
jgi:hypothetical protein